MNKNGHHDLREEILENIWNLDEQGAAKLPELLDAVQEEGAGEEVERLTANGLLRKEGDTLTLTPQGREQARHVVRANRLAARLLTDILELPASVIETQACRLEHAISPLVADRLCTFLGHPPVAPDGRPIPPGACCKARTEKTTPAISTLTELGLGHSGRVAYIHLRVPGRMEQLSSLGLIPGTTVRLRQRHPSVVVEMGESTLALDLDVARDIFVKPV